MSDCEDGQVTLRDKSIDFQVASARQKLRFQQHRSARQTEFLFLIMDASPIFHYSPAGFSCGIHNVRLRLQTDRYLASRDGLNELAMCAVLISSGERHPFPFI